MTRPHAWASVALLACCVLAARHARASRSAQAPDADSLYHRAIEQLSRGTPDDRRIALRDLSEAARAAGARAEILNAVARAYTAMGEHERARACLDQVTRLAPPRRPTALRPRSGGTRIPTSPPRRTRPSSISSPGLLTPFSCSAKREACDGTCGPSCSRATACRPRSSCLRLPPAIRTCFP